MNALISVIVPIYNVEIYLNKCIESIAKQTYHNLEIILVDDGSPDNCPNMCDEWAEKDSRIKVIHKANGGLSDARNAGLSIATGDYIAFVDSDDYIEPDMYEKLLKVALERHSDIVSCKLRMVYENAEYSVSTEDTEEEIEYLPEEALAALIDDKIRQVVWNKIYRADLIKNILFDVGKYHEDEFWSYKAIGAATKITTVDYTGYNYLQRSGSIMGNDYSLKRLDAVEAKCLRQKYLDEHFPELTQKGLTDIVFTCLYHGQKIFKCLKKSQKTRALAYLKSQFTTHVKKIHSNNLSKKQNIWILSAGISFSLTCKIRNLLKIGV